MAIATIERDPARDSGAADLRFRLLQEICATTEASFWRALDRRTGKSCVVRVIAADREESSRRLGDLHRERTLAERIGHPGVLRCDVPLIEADRIFQLVEPEPARAVELETEGGRLAVLNLLVAAAAVLADAHARGVFHGAFSRTCCLRTSDGRLVVQGFRGDAPSPAAVRDGVAADHRAFLEFAQDMLRHSGGPPPRLRRYFSLHLGDAAPKPSATPLADLGADLRESLEDTFPWPLAATTVPASAAKADAEAPVDSPTLTLEIVPYSPPLADLPPLRVPAATPVASTPAVATPAAATPVAATSSRPATLREESRSTPDAVAPVVGAKSKLRDASKQTSGRAGERLPSRRAEPVAAKAVSSATTIRAGLASDERAHRRDEVDDDAVPARSWRPWIAALVVVTVVGATVHFTSKSRRAAAPAAVPAAAPSTNAVAPTAAAETIRTGNDPVVPRMVEAAPVTQAALDARRVAAPPTRSSAREALVRPSASTPTSARSSASLPRAVPAPDGVASQVVRSRVSTLVAGGTRALNALEPGVAAEAFTAALALAPGDRAAQEGSQRARRLQGVAALMSDAREAAARGDHGRAVQGYSQALSNDPRNRGLSDALSNARRNVGRDATGALLAEGHAALGAGRLEQARAAFEKVLESDPLAPGARRAAEQAATAILLRDEAESRRNSPTGRTSQG